MTSILLEKEKEFHKLNAELEKQTRVLMHEVDSVMKMQNCITNDPKQIQNNIKNCNQIGSGDRWEKYEENPAGLSGISKCLKTKLTLLQCELDDLKTQYKNKCAEVKQLNTDLNKLNEEKNKMHQLFVLQKDQKEKTASQLTSLNAKLQIKEIELAALKKENDKLKKELKTSNLSGSNNEAKLNKIVDENEKYKLNLRQMKQEEKDIRDNHKKQMNDIITINKRLEKQVAEYTNGFKKQMMLVENLKKQKMYLESAKMIQISEEEFSRILDWKPNE